MHEEGAKNCEIVQRKQLNEATVRTIIRKKEEIKSRTSLMNQNAFEIQIG